MLMGRGPFDYSISLKLAFVFPKIILSSSLLEAVTIFTDASGHGTAAYYTKDCHKFEHSVFASAQRAELYAFHNNLSIYTVIVTMW
jgi:hypothetical protein